MIRTMTKDEIESVLLALRTAAEWNLWLLDSHRKPYSDEWVPLEGHEVSWKKWSAQISKWREIATKLRSELGKS